MNWQFNRAVRAYPMGGPPQQLSSSEHTPSRGTNGIQWVLFGMWELCDPVTVEQALGRSGSDA